MRFIGADSAAFEQFASTVRSCVPALAEHVGDPEATLSSALAESAETLRLLALRPPNDDDHLLEVGCGLGLTSAYLERLGFEITSVEPAATGFSWHDAAASSLYKALNNKHRHYAIRADELPALAGPFDLIFSNNVVEHISNPFETLDHLVNLLSPRGRMVHSCPNYTFPYEPHFGIPLLPFRPAATEFVLPGRIKSGDVWASLNFINARQIRSWAARSSVEVIFETGQTAASIERLTQDEEFAKRHASLTKLARALVTLRVTRVIRRLPVALSTPMIFELRVPGEYR